MLQLQQQQAKRTQAAGKGQSPGMGQSESVQMSQIGSQASETEELRQRRSDAAAQRAKSAQSDGSWAAKTATPDRTSQRSSEAAKSVLMYIYLLFFAGHLSLQMGNCWYFDTLSHVNV